MIRSPQLEIQVKKKINPEQSKIFPQCYPVTLQVGPKTSHEFTCDDLDMKKESAHDEYYLAEDVLVGEHKIFLIRVINMLGFLIINVECLRDFQTLATCKACFGQ